MLKKIARWIANLPILYRLAGLAVVGYLLAMILLSLLWSTEPAPFDVLANAEADGIQQAGQTPVGHTTTRTAISLMDILLNKPGGYLTNDIGLPGLWLDNIPEWEFGMVVQLRDFIRIMRNDLSRSQSQSKEDPHLVKAENHIFFDTDSWWLPATESQYSSAKSALEDYLRSLTETSPGSQFYARADNLAAWIQAVETRLGSLSQNLAASVSAETRGQVRFRGAVQAPTEGYTKTPWHEVDNIFYQARGQTYALIHLLTAVERDFTQVLEDKNALVGIQQIIAELEATQAPMYSPVILNGGGFGIWANHSLVMASHVSRANAALIDLRQLLSDG